MIALHDPAKLIVPLESLCPQADTSSAPTQGLGRRESSETSRLAKMLEEGQIVEDFFGETASQLTYYGLSRLHQEVRQCLPPPLTCGGRPGSAAAPAEASSYAPALLTQMFAHVTSSPALANRFASVSCASFSGIITFRPCSSTEASSTYSSRTWGTREKAGGADRGHGSTRERCSSSPS